MKNLYVYLLVAVFALGCGRVEKKNCVTRNVIRYLLGFIRLGNVEDASIYESELKNNDGDVINNDGEDTKGKEIDDNKGKKEQNNALNIEIDNFIEGRLNRLKQNYNEKKIFKMEGGYEKIQNDLKSIYKIEKEYSRKAVQLASQIIKTEVIDNNTKFKQSILMGDAGLGKTYIAKIIKNYIIACKDESEGYGKIKYVRNFKGYIDALVGDMQTLLFDLLSKENKTKILIIDDIPLNTFNMNFALSDSRIVGERITSKNKYTYSYIFCSMNKFSRDIYEGMTWYRNTVLTRVLELFGRILVQCRSKGIHVIKTTNNSVDNVRLFCDYMKKTLKGILLEYFQDSNCHIDIALEVKQNANIEKACGAIIALIDFFSTEDKIIFTNAESSYRSGDRSVANTWEAFFSTRKSKVKEDNRCETIKSKLKKQQTGYLVEKHIEDFCKYMDKDREGKIVLIDQNDFDIKFIEKITGLTKSSIITIENEDIECSNITKDIDKYEVIVIDGQYIRYNNNMDEYYCVKDNYIDDLYDKGKTVIIVDNNDKALKKWIWKKANQKVNTFNSNTGNKDRFLSTKYFVK